MSRSLFFLLLIALTCREKQSNFSPNEELIHSPVSVKIGLSDTLWVDLSQSKILWKGTKMRGLGKHEGEISLKKDFILKNHGQWIGGDFEIDMEKIRVTDIPESDPIPLRNLTHHLRDEDFFDVDKYPISKFSLRKIKAISQGRLIFSGDLEIKGITRPISFEATQDGNQVLSIFSIDRFDWDIAYTGSWADRTLVDREIEFRVKLVLK